MKKGFSVLALLISILGFSDPDLDVKPIIHQRWDSPEISSQPDAEIVMDREALTQALEELKTAIDS